MHLAKECLTLGMGKGNNEKKFTSVRSLLSFVLDPFKQAVLARKVSSLH